MKIWRKVTTIILIALIIYPYFKTEYLTYKYVDEFNDINIYGGYFSELEYIKVFDYQNNFAEVYYVSKNKGYGILLSLKMNKNGLWNIDEFIKAWSKTGTADDFIWPYYP